MKLAKGLPPPSKGDKRLLMISASIFVISCIIVVISVTSRSNASVAGANIVSSVGTSVPAEIVARLTAMPSAPPLSGPQADDVHAVAQMVANCNEYSQPRRDQMNQHIAWLLQPSTLPSEIIIALGTNTNGRLIFGMATYTLAQWGEKQKAPDSCLLTIGKKLNDMLVANGEARFKEFDGT